MSDDIAPRQLVPAELDEQSGGGEASQAEEGWSTMGIEGPVDAGASGLEAVFDVPVKVQAVLGRSRMDIGELMRLRPGDVVELDRRVGEPVDIFVNNRLIARGEVVLIDNALGVTLTEIVRQDR